MKKRCLFPGLMLVYIVSFMCLSGEAKITVEVEMYSGRSNPPPWEMSASEISELKTRLGNLPPAEVPEEIPSYGFVHIKVEGSEIDLPYQQVYVFREDNLVLVDKGNLKEFYSDNIGLLDWLLELGNQHDPSYVPPLYKTLPPNTPYIAVMPSYFQETVTEGSLVRRTLTIFSEGNAPLEGFIETPPYVSVDRGTFRLEAVEDLDDFILTIDTGEPREIVGEVVVKSNDPSNPELRIPLKFIVKPSAGGRSVDVNRYIPYIILIAAVVFVALVYLKTRKK